MKLDIRFSLRAREEEIELLEYLNEKFGREKAREVFERIDSVLNLISMMPNMFPESHEIDGLRKCVFSKQTSIYYRVNKDFIEVVSIWTNYKNPNEF